MRQLSGALVLAVALFLLGQAVAAWLRPKAVRRFLAGFATTPARHYAEMFLRLLAGGALVHFAPHMNHGRIFALFGMVVLGTTVVLLLLPWRLHRRFAAWAVPLATRRLGPYMIGCALAGAFIIHGLVTGTGDNADCCNSLGEFVQWFEHR